MQIYPIGTLQNDVGRLNTQKYASYEGRMKIMQTQTNVTVTMLTMLTEFKCKLPEFKFEFTMTIMTMLTMLTHLTMPNAMENSY